MLDRILSNIEVLSKNQPRSCRDGVNVCPRHLVHVETCGNQFAASRFGNYVVPRLKPNFVLLCLSILDHFVPGDGCARSMLLSNLSMATHGQAQVQHMLENGRVQDKERIIDVVKARILDFAMDKHSSAALSSQDATSALCFI